MSPAPRRTVLITGCSDGGLGSYLAIEFHKAGWRVFATARNVSKLQNVKALGIETLQLDTLSEESISDCIAEVSTLTGGSLDMLVNNAGAGYNMPILDVDLAKVRDLFELNTFSLIAVTRAFLPLLMKSTATHRSGRGGTIVNNTSVSSQTPGALAFQGTYNATKAAATSITENLRLELAPFGIKVVNLVTGSLKSAFHSNATQEPLPASSIYNVAKEAVLKTMSGEENTNNGGDPVKWAKKVVATLGKTNPPYWLWAGKYSAMVWLATFLPVGFLDNLGMKSLTGLDVLE